MALRDRYGNDSLAATGETPTASRTDGSLSCSALNTSSSDERHGNQTVTRRAAAPARLVAESSSRRSPSGGHNIINTGALQQDCEVRSESGSNASSYTSSVRRVEIARARKRVADAQVREEERRVRAEQAQLDVLEAEDHLERSSVRSRNSRHSGGSLHRGRAVADRTEREMRNDAMDRLRNSTQLERPLELRVTQSINETSPLAIENETPSLVRGLISQFESVSNSVPHSAREQSRAGASARSRSRERDVRPALTDQASGATPPRMPDSDAIPASVLAYVDSLPGETPEEKLEFLLRQQSTQPRTPRRAQQSSPRALGGSRASSSEPRRDEMTLLAIQYLRDSIQNRLLALPDIEPRRAQQQARATHRSLLFMDRQPSERM